MRALPAGWLLAGWLLAGLAAASSVFVVRRRLARTRRAVSHAEHELRGPLTAVLLAVDLGLRDDGLGAGRLSVLRAELRRTERALGDLARARQGLAPITEVIEVDVPGVVRASVEAWRPAAVARGVTLEFAGDTHCAPLLGDPVRLAQATGNLIANAIEHGGSRVRVTAGSAAGRIRVAVTDDGPGLPRGILAGPCAFSGARGVRPRRRRRGVRGGRPAPVDRGQGLAIVAGIAVAHGGRLRAGRRPGASLVLELPAAPRPRAPRAAPHA